VEGRVLMRSDDAYYRLAGLLLSSTVTGSFTVSFYARHLWRRINPVPVALVIGLVGLLLVLKQAIPEVDGDIRGRFTSTAHWRRVA
jgi:uncharacterized membrane protein